jgi:hypothetical protein
MKGDRKAHGTRGEKIRKDLKYCGKIKTGVVR